MKDKYIIVESADEYYEDGSYIASFDNYNDALDYLKNNKMDLLIDNLNYLESIKDRLRVFNGLKEIVVCYR